MSKQVVLYIVLFFTSTSLLSQPCQVNVDSLKGQYTGACKKGQADGIGTAIGVDSYTGSFKNGYPDGQGKYTWKNGNWYEGSWKKGLFEGQGTLSTIDDTKPSGTSVLTGFWNRGKYTGIYEKPYVAHTLTNNISDVNIRKLNCTVSEITLVVKNITGGASSLGYPALPKSRLVDIQTIEGRYDEEEPDEASSRVSNKYVFRRITYPFFAIFSFETTGTDAKLTVEKLSIEFFENCNWFVQVAIDH